MPFGRDVRPEGSVRFASGSDAGDSAGGGADARSLMSPELQSLTRLAVAYGIEPQWYDIWGHAHEVSEATLRAVLAAMHVQAGDDAQVQRALYERERATWREPLPPAVVVRESALPARLVVRFPEEWDADELSWRLLEENGEQHSAAFVFGTLPEAERREMDGQRFVARLPDARRKACPRIPPAALVARRAGCRRDAADRRAGFAATNRKPCGTTDARGVPRCSYTRCAPSATGG